MVELPSLAEEIGPAGHVTGGDTVVLVPPHVVRVIFVEQGVVCLHPIDQFIPLPRQMSREAEFLVDTGEELFPDGLIGFVDLGDVEEPLFVVNDLL